MPPRGPPRRPPRRPLPSVISAGYANWGECDGKVELAARTGVNVIIWFAIELTVAPGGKPVVSGGPNLTCVADTAARLEAGGLPTHHFISVGGWDAPHPDPAVPLEAWWAALTSWDESAERAGLRGGFDGLDWDLEGNDDRSSPRSRFSAAGLRLVADLSARAKASGRFVSLAPPQSYLDASTDEFSLSLALPARCWHAEFAYAGRNAYAALLALAPPDTFDFVSLQLYESWPRASCTLGGE
mmetsp:Transcript_2893/g.9367  ORF Transcript_2893/g.9367 Transcript_2893/m.9367 type:complete len:242 (-) Transcript_2893:198-923(-)